MSTTRTVNYTITRGVKTTSVNATITTTRGVNLHYFRTAPGILKIIEVLVGFTALILAVYSRWHYSIPYLDGEGFFICACSIGFAATLILLISYFISTPTAIVIPRLTIYEIFFNISIGLIYLIAGAVMIGVVHPKYKRYSFYDYKMAAGALALIAALLHFISAFLAWRDYKPRSR